MKGGTRMELILMLAGIYFFFAVILPAVLVVMWILISPALLFLNFLWEH